MHLGIVLDPLAGLNPKKDSSIAMLRAAARRGHEIHYMTLSDLYVRDGVAMAEMTRLDILEDEWRWCEEGDVIEQPLAVLDAVLMRKDPPFDMNYIYATYVLELAERAGLLVVNRPASLRDCNEKFFITQFPECCAPTLISSDMTLLREFHKEHSDIIVKPLDGMGGSGVFHIRADGANLGSVTELLTSHGHRPVMAQRYIPEIRQGDKRILMVDGEPVPYCLARVPDADPTRGNLAAGGKGVPQILTPRDYWIAERVGPELRRRGLLFVGIDVIGDYLTEINVTSPTCIREIEARYPVDIAGQVIMAVERYLFKGEAA